MKVITIIPARGGSKSIPMKNIQKIKNKPLVAYSIEYSLKSKSISKTIVSTDSTEIAEISRQYGADIPFIRPSEFAEDNSKDFEFMRHAHDYFEGKGEKYDLYVLLRPTSPMRPKGLIEKAIQIFKSNPNISSVRSVTKVKEHPYRTWSINNDGEISGFVNNIKEPYNMPRQELPDIFFQTGDIEVISSKTIKEGSISGSSIYPVIIEHSEMIDIDDWDDLRKASQHTEK